MPNNFLHVCLIRLVLPNAKIIDARRHPMACCFSGYKQNFAAGQRFTYSLEDLARYYCDYVELMAHVDKVMPGQPFTALFYERMVEDTESEVRRLLHYCGLPFEAHACASTKTTAPSAPRARSKSASPYFEKEWNSGAILSPGWGP